MTKQISNPNLLDIFQLLKVDIFNNFNCHRIGKINIFNSSNQTASIELVDRATLPISTGDGKILKTFPLLVDCPVYVNKSNSGGFTRPIIVGEYCLVLFNDRNIENWFNNGGINELADSRTHNLTDCLIIPGIFSDSNPLGDYNNSATEMNLGSTKISLDSKVGISNSSKSLKDLIEQLINALIALQVVDPISGNLPITAATATALNQAITDFNLLLKT